MRVVLDTNIIVSALIAPSCKPAAIIRVWLAGKFTLLTCGAHVDELWAALQKPGIATHVKPHAAGRLVNHVRKLAEDIDPLPPVKRSADPTDDFLLVLSEAGKADYLVTGDKSGLLGLGRHKGTQILSARDFFALIS
jgi:putative PIN family toxin of toxin-antitoxin system